MLMSYATTVEHRIVVRWMEEDFQTHPKIITIYGVGVVVVADVDAAVVVVISFKGRLVILRKYFLLVK